MPDIRAMGNFLTVDEDGFFVNESSVEKIVSPWKEGVEDIWNMYRERLGDALHSVYIRGSVSCGEAIEGVSDIDTFALVHSDLEMIDLTWISEEQKRLELLYPFATGVELEVKFLNDVLAGKRYFHEFCIVAMATCVYGEDVASKLRRFKPDGALAQGVHGDLAKRIEQTKQEIAIARDAHERIAWCAFIMKRIIRTGCAIVIEKTGKYSRDLYPCAAVFSEYYPEKSQEMREALELGVNPVDDTERILALLDTFGMWMAERIEEQAERRRGSTAT